MFKKQARLKFQRCKVCPNNCPLREAHHKLTHLGLLGIGTIEYASEPGETAKRILEKYGNAATVESGIRNYDLQTYITCPTDHRDIPSSLSVFYRR